MLCYILAITLLWAAVWFMAWFFYGFFCPLKAHKPHQIISLLVFLTLLHQMGSEPQNYGNNPAVTSPSLPHPWVSGLRSMCLTLLPSQGNYKADFFLWLCLMTHRALTACVHHTLEWLIIQLDAASIQDICTDWDLLWLRIRRILSSSSSFLSAARLRGHNSRSSASIWPHA